MKKLVKTWFVLPAVLVVLATSCVSSPEPVEQSVPRPELIDWQGAEFGDSIPEWVRAAADRDYDALSALPEMSGKVAMAFSGTFSYGASGLSRLLSSLLLGSGMLAAEWHIGAMRVCRYQTLLLIYTAAMLFAGIFLILVPAVFPARRNANSCSLLQSIKAICGSPIQRGPGMRIDTQKNHLLLASIPFSPNQNTGLQGERNFIIQIPEGICFPPCEFPVEKTLIESRQRIRLNTPAHIQRIDFPARMPEMIAIAVVKIQIRILFSFVAAQIADGIRQKQKSGGLLNFFAIQVIACAMHEMNRIFRSIVIGGEIMNSVSVHGIGVSGMKTGQRAVFGISPWTT